MLVIFTSYTLYECLVFCCQLGVLFCRPRECVSTRCIYTVNLVSHDIFIESVRLRQADDAALSWLEYYAEVGATLVVYRVRVFLTDSPVHRVAVARHNVSMHRATCHDAILALYHCARARWLATSGDSCQCMTGRDDFLSTLSHVRARRCRLLLQKSQQ